MKVNGLGLASEEMNHVKNLLYVSKLRTRKSGLCLSLHIFGVVNGCSSQGRQASAGQTPQPDSLKKVLAFKKFAISFSKPLGPLLSFHSRLPDACLVLDLAGWPWVFISFLTTTALFGHLTFYTSPKWEPQLKKRDPNHTEGRTMDNLCCPKMESTVCRSLLGELQSLIWYWTHADKWTWSAVFKLESMHQKRWCPSTHQTSGKQLLTVSLLGANTAREAKLLHWKCAPYLSVLKRLTRPQSWPLAAAWGQPYHHRGTPGYLQTSVAALRNTQRGGLQGWTGGICRARNRGREEGDSNSGAEEEGQTSNVTRHETVSTAKERCGDEEMEREGAVPQDCWTKGVCKAPLLLTGFSNTWELLQLFQTFTFYFSHH